MYVALRRIGGDLLDRSLQRFGEVINGRYGNLHVLECPAHQLVHDLKSKRAITFELRFAEELVARRLMRERRICAGISSYACPFDAVITGLDVKQEAVLSAVIGGAVLDLPERA